MYRGWIHDPPVPGPEIDPRAHDTNRYGLPPKDLRHGSFHEWLACGEESR